MLWDIWYYHLKYKEMLYLTISWCHGSKLTDWLGGEGAGGVDLKRSLDLRWLFDPVLLIILRWSCFNPLSQDISHRQDFSNPLSQDYSHLLSQDGGNNDMRELSGVDHRQGDESQRSGEFNYYINSWQKNNGLQTQIESKRTIDL